jgi:hypothetical protein
MATVDVPTVAEGTDVAERTCFALTGPRRTRGDLPEHYTRAICAVKRRPSTLSQPQPAPGHQEDPSRF